MYSVALANEQQRAISEHECAGQSENNKQSPSRGNSQMTPLQRERQLFFCERGVVVSGYALFALLMLMLLISMLIVQ